MKAVSKGKRPGAAGKKAEPKNGVPGIRAPF